HPHRAAWSAKAIEFRPWQSPPTPLQERPRGPMGGPSKHALIFIFFTVLIDTIAFGIVMPVLPKLLTTLTGDSVEQVTFLAGWLLAIYAGLQFIFGPVIGNLS